VICPSQSLPIRKAVSNSLSTNFPFCRNAAGIGAEREAKTWSFIQEGKALRTV